MIPAPESLGLTFHHVGVACASIAREVSTYERLGYVREGPVYRDTAQKIEALFLAGAGPRLELVKPLAPDSPAATWIRRGARLYHLAYEADDLNGALEALGGTTRAKVLVEPVAAIAFGGRAVAFVLLPNLLLLELVSKH
jgi:methylmalonyl-CoA/ethylmalonyl-CoA epimerase